MGLGVIVNQWVKYSTGIGEEYTKRVYKGKYGYICILIS